MRRLPRAAAGAHLPGAWRRVAIRGCSAVQGHAAAATTSSSRRRRTRRDDLIVVLIVVVVLLLLLVVVIIVVIVVGIEAVLLIIRKSMVSFQIRGVPLLSIPECSGTR
jgi:hypothetical protein